MQIVRRQTSGEGRESQSMRRVQTTTTTAQQGEAHRGHSAAPSSLRPTKSGGRLHPLRQNYRQARLGPLRRTPETRRGTAQETGSGAHSSRLVPSLRSALSRPTKGMCRLSSQGSKTVPRITIANTVRSYARDGYGDAERAESSLPHMRSRVWEMWPADRPQSQDKNCARDSLRSLQPWHWDVPRRSQCASRCGSILGGV